MSWRRWSWFWQATLSIGLLGVLAEWAGNALAIAEFPVVPLEMISHPYHFSWASLAPLGVAVLVTFGVSARYGRRGQVASLLLCTLVHGFWIYEGEAGDRLATIHHAWTGGVLARAFAWLTSIVCMALCGVLIPLGFFLMRRYSRHKEQRPRERFFRQPSVDKSTFG